MRLVPDCINNSSSVFASLVLIRRCDMKKLIAKTVVACAAVSLILHLFASPARAVDRMGDWTAQNTSAPVGIDPAAPNYYFAPDNNYGLITNTSVGGTIQSKINFGSPVQYPTD